MSSNKRQVILMGALLLVLSAYLYQSRFYSTIGGGYSEPKKVKPLPGKNSVSGLAVSQDKNGTWIADFDYYYTGEPGSASLQLSVLPPDSLNPSFGEGPHLVTGLTPELGNHHVSNELPYPLQGGKTTKVLAALISYSTTRTEVARNEIDFEIEWPDLQTWQLHKQLINRKPAQNLEFAIKLIDSESDAALNQAKTVLEHLISEDSKFDAAYVELARVSMKTKWGPEGIHEAENLLESALRINPESVNAKILLGYVYAHQQNYGKAESLFVDSEKNNPRNLWLWSNWGEMLELQGKTDQAIVKYKTAITRPMTHDTYDRARIFAYTKLIAILNKKKNYDEVERTYKQRIAEFGPGSCYSYDYSRFLLYVRGNIPASIEVSRNALKKNCDDTKSREVLGLAEYVMWAATDDKTRTEHLDQARIYLPESAKAGNRKNTW